MSENIFSYEILEESHRICQDANRVLGITFDCSNCGFEYDLEYSMSTDDGRRICMDCIEGLGPEDSSVGLGC